MEPLSCSNCCHNPLQLGPVGTAVGYCTRHRLALLAPHQTTCGQLLRKDLLRERALEERTLHRKAFPENKIRDLHDRAIASDRGLAEAPNGELSTDPVADEVLGYGKLPSKSATLAALRRIAGARAEVAFLSLGRAYFANCVSRGGPWTAGGHLLWWTLERLLEVPVVGPEDLREPIGAPLRAFLEIGRWRIVAMRLALLADVGNRAGDDPVGRLPDTLRKAMTVTKPGSATHLLGWLRRNHRQFTHAMSRSRYEELRGVWHKEQN